LTPASSRHVRVVADREDVLCTGFRTARRGGVSYTIHVANLGAGRSASVQGLPRAIDFLQVVRTSETEAVSSLPPVAVIQGKATIDLASQSLTTLVGHGRPQRRRASGR
jgi:hypothetical protein